MSEFNNLFNFVDRAVKNRNYAENTGWGFKAALRLFEKELNEEEKNSLGKFKDNLDRIYLSVARKNANDFNAQSLLVYKNRVTKVLNDYENYGIDPTKMASWPRKNINRVPKTKSPKIKDNQYSSNKNNTERAYLGEEKTLENMHHIKLALRPGVEFILIVPMDINKSESLVVKSVLDSIVKEDNYDQIN